MAATRKRLGPPKSGFTVHGIGDVHAGVMSLRRMSALSLDARKSGYVPDVVVQLGDSSDTGLTSQDSNFKRLMARIAPQGWYSVMGNHDIMEDVRTPADWATEYGYAAQSYVVDFPAIRLICWSPPESYNPWPQYTYVSESELAWLDARLSETVNPCIIACHYPLHGTVGGTAGADYLSTSVPFYLRTAAHPSDSSDILAILAEHPNVKLWIHGHTHSRPEVPGFAAPVTAGSVTFAHVCAGSPLNEGATVEDGTDRCHSVFSTVIGDLVEVRVRDHGAGQWMPIGGRPVMRINTARP